MSVMNWLRLVSHRFVLAAAITAILCVLPACGGGGGSTQPPPASSITYTALGASVTFGIAAVPLSEGYVPMLAERMGQVRSNVRLNNLGINGARIEDLISSELTAAIATDPDVVTVMTGSNDIIGGQNVASFGSQLDSLLAELRDETDALVFVGDIPDLTAAPRFRLKPDPDVTRQRISSFNARIRQSAQANGAILVRVSDLVIDDSIFAIDGFHPNNKGHRRLTDLLWGVIAPRL